VNALALTVDGFGVAFGTQTVLADVNFVLPARGMTVIVGPAGSGKSTLVRTLAGLNDGHPSLTTWGTVTSSSRPALVMQHARFFVDTVRENLVSALPDRSALDQREQTERVISVLRACRLDELVPVLGKDAVELTLSSQRRLAIARALIGDPGVLMADEPTVGLDELEAAAVVAMLRRESRQRAVVLITHHQRFARAAGGMTMLLAAGRIQETAETSRFFATPRTALAQQFLRTGGCTPVSGVPIDDADAAPPRVVERKEPQSRFVGPRGFFWVIPGQLGGMPRPGIIDRLEHDVEGLQRLGVTCLITLEERATVDAESLSLAGIESIHFPIIDMGIPEVGSAIELCRLLAVRMAAGEVVTYHCRAGQGRTGMMLACQLIIAGQSAAEALHAVRSINPRCVESNVQAELLRTFAMALSQLPEDTKPENKTNQEDPWR